MRFTVEFALTIFDNSNKLYINTNMNKHEELLRQIEAKFEHRVHLPEGKEAVSNALSELGITTLDAVLSVLSNSKDMSTKALIPYKPRGAMSLIGFAHSDSVTGEISDRAIDSSATIYRHLHNLRESTAQEGVPAIFVEGPPYTFSTKQDPKWMVPGTTTSVFSKQGQELLRLNNGAIENLCRQMHCQYADLLWHKLFPQVHGIEKEESHTQSLQTVQSHSQSVWGFGPSDRQILQGLIEGIVGFSRTHPKNLSYNGQIHCSLPDFIHRCERYIEGIRAFARMQERRDKEAIQRAESVMPHRIAQIIYGANHIRGMMEKCLQNRIALLFSLPSGLQVSARDTFQFVDSEDNDDYVIIKYIIPQLKRIESA